ncbi:MAG: hypothetical protein GY846_04280 [Deltaproteobacteria bacterium]|nr:hypothetical protein [Deltaproteobacteria bacterium]
MIEEIRKKISQEEFDYQTLLVCLKNYARPRDKITSLIKKGSIIRIKKGLYIFGEAYRRRPYSLEILANLIYGPSYISLDFALAYYGMIPERVEAMTSVTTGRSHSFATPVGLFTYRHISLKAFPIGMNRIEMDENLAFLVATPEKALADKLNADQNTGIQSGKGLVRYLTDDLRIDISTLKTLDAESLAEMGRRYGSRKIRLLSELVRDVNQ